MRTGFTRIRPKKHLLFTKNQLENAQEKTLSGKVYKPTYRCTTKSSRDPSDVPIDPDIYKEKEREREGGGEIERDRDTRTKNLI